MVLYQHAIQLIFFIVVNKEIWTSTGEHCLNGVTRGAIIDLCRQNNVLVHEKNFGIEDVYNADEAFVTGTFAGVIPVIEIDGKNMGKGVKGQLTNQIQSWYTNDIKNLSKK